MTFWLLVAANVVLTIGNIYLALTIGALQKNIRQIYNDQWRAQQERERKIRQRI